MLTIDAFGLQATFATIRKVQQEASIEAISLLNFVVSDGITMVATRFASDPHEAPASLYYAEGGSYQRAADSQTSQSPLTATAPGNDAAANAQTARRTSLTGGPCACCCHAKELAQRQCQPLRARTHTHTHTHTQITAVAPVKNGYVECSMSRLFEVIPRLSLEGKLYD